MQTCRTKAGFVLTQKISLSYTKWKRASYRTVCQMIPFFEKWKHFVCVRACVVMSNCLRPHGLPGYGIHGILQTRILEQVAISSSRGSSQPRHRTHIYYVSYVGRPILYPEPPTHPGSPLHTQKPFVCICSRNWIALHTSCNRFTANLTNGHLCKGEGGRGGVGRQEREVFFLNVLRSSLHTIKCQFILANTPV